MSASVGLKYLVVGLLAVTLPNSDSGAQIMRLPYADTTRGNYFGTSVALDGHRAIVGASAEQSCGDNSGAAYVYLYNDSTGYWEAEARLVPSECESGLFFGRRVALHGQYAMVASSRERVAAQAPNIVYLFERDSSRTWHEIQRLTIAREVEEGAFGEALVLDKERALITTAGDATRARHGAAYVYELKDGIWRMVERLSASAGVHAGIFGGDAALAGDIMAVSSSGYFNRRAGSVYLFEFGSEAAWSESARIPNVHDFFISVDVYNDEVLVGQAHSGPNNAGSATLYARDSTGTWQLSATLTPPTPYGEGSFGTDVALYGDRALVVGYDEQLKLDFNIDRVVYIYARENNTWRYQGILDIGQVAFGTAIDLEGNTALVGAASVDEPGAAYVIRIP